MVETYIGKAGDKDFEFRGQKIPYVEMMKGAYEDSPRKDLDKLLEPLVAGARPKRQ